MRLIIRTLFPSPNQTEFTPDNARYTQENYTSSQSCFLQIFSTLCILHTLRWNPALLCKQLNYWHDLLLKMFYLGTLQHCIENMSEDRLNHIQVNMYFFKTIEGAIIEPQVYLASLRCVNSMCLCCLKVKIQSFEFKWKWLWFQKRYHWCD